METQQNALSGGGGRVEGAGEWSEDLTTWRDWGYFLVSHRQPVSPRATQVSCVPEYLRIYTALSEI